MTLRKTTTLCANLAALGLIWTAATGHGLGISEALAQVPSLASMSLSLPSGSMVSVAEPSSLALLATALGAASFGVARLRRTRNSAV